MKGLQWIYIVLINEINVSIIAAYGLAGETSFFELCLLAYVFITIRRRHIFLSSPMSSMPPYGEDIPFEA